MILLVNLKSWLLCLYGALFVNSRLRGIKLSRITLGARSKSIVVNCISVSTRGSHWQLLAQIRIIATSHWEFCLLVFDFCTLQWSIFPKIILGFGTEQLFIVKLSSSLCLLSQSFLLSFGFSPVSILLSFFCILHLLLSFLLFLLGFFLTLLSLDSLSNLLFLLLLTLLFPLLLHDLVKIVLL